MGTPWEHLKGPRDDLGLLKGSLDLMGSSAHVCLGPS